MADLTGKITLVTGATSGIGKETARQLLAGGAEVIVSGRDQMRVAAARFMTTASKAAEDVVWAAADGSLAEVSGAYLKHRKQIRASARSGDRQLAGRMWETTQRLLATTS